MEQPPPGSLEELRSDLARAVRRICPAWLADHADDLVQVALLKVMEVQRKSEGKAALSSFYLKRVARSTLIDEIRRRKRRPEVPLDETVESHPAMWAAYPDPESAAVGRELGRTIQTCLGRLIRPRQAAVMLHVFLGHSVPEAARLLGWSVKKAENLVYRGLADLQGCLKREGAAP
jgi:RNA polymerase sigma-70 factor (ECF subfamily)